MSEFSLSTETWLGIGTMIGGVITAVLGVRFGGRKREETKERVVGLSIAGGLYQTGQTAVVQQVARDALDVGKEAVAAIKDQTRAVQALTDSIEHFDETTEREARDHTRSRLDEINDMLKKLDDK